LSPDREPNALVDGLKETAIILLESGIPQEAMRTIGNVSTSIVQAGAQNPVYGLMTVTVAANLARGWLVSKNEATAIKVAAGAYVAQDLLARTGGAASKSVSNSLTYDVPDTPTPRLQLPPQRRELLIPPFRVGRRPKPDPAPSPEPSPETQLRERRDPFPVDPILIPEEFVDPESGPSGIDPAFAAGAVAAGAGGAAAILGGPERRVVQIPGATIG